MKTILNRLTQYQTLSNIEAKDLMTAITQGKWNASQMAAFMTVYMMRSITLDELKGFQQALLDVCRPVDLSDFETIDLCGTGGDAKNTFNISTLASFVTAGSGIKVSKHGNYGVSSACGSSNVLEHLGLKFSNNHDFLVRCIEQAGICILHAPLFHPAMKNIATIRRDLAMKTLFNILGPLVNPARPRHQLIGVFNLGLLRLYGYFMQKTTQNFAIVYALQGYDEISLTCPTKVMQRHSEKIVLPEDFGLLTLQPEQIQGGDTVDSAAQIFINILQGEGTEAQRAVVCANAGMAIALVKNIPVKEGFAIAHESLVSGKARKSFEVLRKLAQE